MHLNRPAAAPRRPRPPPKDAQASLSLEFTGRASTPGALVTVATGKGELKLGEVSMHAPTPLAVVATSDAVLSGQAGGSGEQLATALRAQIDASAVAVGPRTIPIEIADGAAKLALVTLDSDAGTTKVETTIDLASLVVDSAWLAEPKAPDVSQADKPRGGALPSVGIVYTGPLANAWALESRITAEPLERELAIRKMELDADQLERLRNADAERARRDDERRRALEADQGSIAPAPRRAALPCRPRRSRRSHPPTCRSVRPRRSAGRRGRARHSAEQRQRARRPRAAGSGRSAGCRAGRRRSGHRRRPNRTRVASHRTRRAAAIARARARSGNCRSAIR